ncbi:unannotated protein [freshwater metagenome]|uniref:Unannotated protein n=1 Tax=freshwater metagenome TaxID=449393 RepID=A0A6J7DB28_9ZZZZ|nr:diaminopimelate epimerase [Actinomycetota bacterium]
MRFEKWQALGNDYLILDARELSFSLTPSAVRLLCDRHRGIGADGVLELREPDAEGFVARLRIHNPDGSEAELSGNGARQAVLYLHRAGWTDSPRFSIQTAAGEIRPTIGSPTTCSLDMGRARLQSSNFPSGTDDGRGVVRAGSRDWSFQHIEIGNPQCAIRVNDVAELEQLDLALIGPEIETNELFPRRTNVSWWTPVGVDEIRARIFERGVGETLSSGTGACGAAIASVLDGAGSLVTVHLDGGSLEVTVGEDLHIDLAGWAVPVHRGEFSQELLAELRGG